MGENNVSLNHQIWCSKVKDFIIPPSFVLFFFFFFRKCLFIYFFFRRRRLFFLVIIILSVISHNAGLFPSKSLDRICCLADTAETVILTPFWLVGHHTQVLSLVWNSKIFNTVKKISRQGSGGEWGARAGRVDGDGRAPSQSFHSLLKLWLDPRVLDINNIRFSYNFLLETFSRFDSITGRVLFKNIFRIDEEKRKNKGRRRRKLGNNKKE